MVFTPDTDTNWQAYRYFVEGNSSADQSSGAANPPVNVSDHDLAQFTLGLIQWLCEQCTLGTTLVTNSGTTQSPNGSLIAGLNAAKSFARGGNRSF
jgi:hypothetical protein